MFLRLQSDIIDERSIIAMLSSLREERATSFQEFLRASLVENDQLAMEQMFRRFFQTDGVRLRDHVRALLLARYLKQRVQALQPD